MLRNASLLLALASSAALASDGEELFNNTCAACHQKGGTGSPGLAPPLANRSLWTRLGSAAPTYIQGVMLAGMSGPIEIEGQVTSGLVMPPQERMSNEELAAIGNYVLGTLNGLSSTSLSEASVSLARTAPMTHGALRDLRKSGK